MSMYDTHIEEIKPSATVSLVVATVDKCLAQCEICPGYYTDSLTGRFRVNCNCSHHYIKEQ
jgi:hypothetical protein